MNVRWTRKKQRVLNSQRPRPPRASTLLALAGILLISACSQPAPPSPTAATKATAPASGSSAAASPAVPATAASPAAAPVASPAASPAAATKPTAAVDPALSSIWQGKTLTIIAGEAPGSANDTTARIMSRHLGRHLPGEPTIIVQNMPGGSHRIAMNFLYTAKADGLTLGIVDLNVPFYQLSGEGAEQGVRYDVNKMHWLGSPTVVNQLLAAHHRAGATPSDLSPLATREVKMANTAAGDSPHVIQAVLNGVFGWKLKPIFGYQGTQNRQLGVIRGEVDGMVSTWDSFRRTMGDEFRAKNMLPLLAIGDLGNDPLLAGVSTLDKLVASKSADDKALVDLAVRRYDWGRPMVAPPDTSANVVSTIRAAVSRTFVDPAFLADAQQIELEVIPVSGERVQELMTSFMQTPKPVLDRMQALIDAESDN